MLTASVLDKVTGLGKELALTASEMMRNRFQGKLNVQMKGDASNVVTELDGEIEQFVRGEVRKHFPDHGVLGEELGDLNKTSDWLWIVDPIDGTQNFVTGIKMCVFSLAVYYRNDPVIGIVVNPFHQEMFMARRDGGCVCNGERVFVRERSQLQGSVILIEFANNQLSLQFDTLSENLTRAEGSMRIFGSSALALAHVASGRADGCILGEANPWDIAAGIFLIREAGGTVRNWSGETYTLFKGGGLFGSSEVLAKQMEKLISGCKVNT